MYGVVTKHFNEKVQIYLEYDQWRNIFYSLKRLE